MVDTRHASCIQSPPLALHPSPTKPKAAALPPTPAHPSLSLATAPGLVVSQRSGDQRGLQLFAKPSDVVGQEAEQ